MTTTTLRSEIQQLHPVIDAIGERVRARDLAGAVKLMNQLDAKDRSLLMCWYATHHAVCEATHAPQDIPRRRTHDA